MSNFNKPALAIAQQITLLQQRGMRFADTQLAGFYLSQINYYRLGAYWLPFELDHATHCFRDGTSFEQVLRLYMFDRSLRLLILDAIEHIEVAVRTRWAFEMAHRHGPHGYLEVALAKSIKSWNQNLATLIAEIARSDERFIAHYREHYAQPELPPVWAACEVMSLGLLSRWYAQLGPMATRRAIASHFDCDQQQFEGLLEHLTYVRNVCAHHSRIWNRRFTKTMPLPRTKPIGVREQLNLQAERQVFNTLSVMLYLLDRIMPGHTWRKRLLQLLGDYPDVSKSAMGFPLDWQSSPLWAFPVSEKLARETRDGSAFHPVPLG